MSKIGKAVDVVRAHEDHPPEKFYHNGVPILLSIDAGTSAVQLIGKDVEAYRPRHDCPDWANVSADDEDANEDGAIFRYDERGDQICTGCGYMRNQETSDTKLDHQHAGRYDGFSTGVSANN